MEILLPIIYVLFFLIIIYKWKPFNDLIPCVKIRLSVFVLKLLGGVAVWYIYTHYYTYRGTSDAHRFFDDASIMYSSLSENPIAYFKMLFGIDLQNETVLSYTQQMTHWKKPYSYGILNDNPFIIRLNAVVMLFSFGVYHVHTVFFAFFAFLGQSLIFATFKKLIQKHLLAIAVFLVPSVWFWSSGVLKEAPLFLLLGIFIYSVFHFKNKLVWYLILLISSIGLIFIKGYVLLCLLPACLFLFYSNNKKIGTLWSWILAHATALVLFFISPLLPVGFNALNKLRLKQTDFINVAKLQNAGSEIEPLNIDSNLEFLTSIPQAISNTWFRPFIYEAKGALQFFNAIENVMLLLLLCFAIIFRKTSMNKLEKMSFGFSISFVLSLGVLAGWVVPILGALVRYKIPAMPFFLIAMLILIDFKKVKRKFSKK